MSKKEFDAMLKKHESKSMKNEIDWVKQKNEWLDFIKQFYDSIELWLSSYVAEKQLEYTYSDLELVEDYIGTYQTKKMKIVLADQVVNIEPVGTLLIGTKGRIDMEGTRGRVRFMLADKESIEPQVNVSVSINGMAHENHASESLKKAPDWVWKIVLKEPRKIVFTEFNQENFFSALMEIINA
jgi:hypothetical protein